MRQFNSTIRIKKKNCSRCGKSEYIFSKGRCKQCSTIEDTLAREEAELEQDESLSELIKQADDIYSKWLRLSNADKNGTVSCYTCDLNMRWQSSQCGHYIKRGNLFLRFDPRNTKVQGECCNIHKRGNYPEFAKRLEVENPGITEILYTEGQLVYKPSREEIRAIINEYSAKFKLLQNAIK